MSLNTITIVGGGLAGLALGIGLRQRNVPVRVYEAFHYPRNRVCGEFISGPGQEALERLHLGQEVIDVGARLAKTAAFYSERGSHFSMALPRRALCLSRFVLDELLARKLQQLGGELYEGSRWRQSDFPEGTVRATGRRVTPKAGGWRWFGLKAYARDLKLDADLEMHFGRHSYVGLCRLSNGLVNVCGLFRSRTPAANLNRQWPDWLRGSQHSMLYQRLGSSNFEPGSFCSVAGFSMKWRPPELLAECSVGDAFSVMPPFTGNGISMAFESAELAVEPLVAYSQGKQTWQATTMEVAHRCHRHFRKRFAYATVLQQLLFLPAGQQTLFLLLPRLKTVFDHLFLKTRSQ